MFDMGVIKAGTEKRDALVSQVLQDIGLQNLVNLETLQNLQDNLAAVTGIAMVTVDYKGNPVTTETSFTSFCQARREIAECKANCFFSDAYGSLKAAMTNRQYIYRCPMGLVDCAVPIIVEDNHIGGVLMGQVRCSDAETSSLEGIKNIVQNEIDLEDYPDLLQKFYETEEISLSHLEKTAQLVQYLICEMVEKQLLVRIQEELRGEVSRLQDKIQLLESEIVLNHKRNQHIPEACISQYMLTSLNMLSTMAITEDADQTLEGINLYAQMLTRVYDSERGLIPLHTEISFIRKAVKVLRDFFHHEVKLEIIAEDSTNDCYLPPFVLYPFVENAILHGILPTETPGKVTVEILRMGRQLQLRVADNGVGFESGYLQNDDQMIGNSRRLSSLDIESTKRRLAAIYQDQVAVDLTSDRSGSQVTISLPVKY